MPKRGEDGRYVREAGMYIDSKGYWAYSAGEHRGRRVHRVLMERHIGRPLRKDEVVHHRDGNKLNYQEHWDGKWNLELKDEKEHNAVSAAQYWFLKTFVWSREERECNDYFKSGVENIMEESGVISTGQASS